MIYIDPPYGIKFASNFQPRLGKRDVKDKEQDLTREPEMVKAYRDTWTLGIHSYLAYLRDRLIVARNCWPTAAASSCRSAMRICTEFGWTRYLVMDEVLWSIRFRVSPLPLAYDHRPRRPGARPDLRQRHHRLRGEQWGRRWITIDTPAWRWRLARQRLLTAKFDYYELEPEQAGPAGGFVYKTVPHITLKSIAQNQALDPVLRKWEPVLDEKLAS
jgi:hypothetical protein